MSERPRHRYGTVAGVLAGAAIGVTVDALVLRKFFRPLPAAVETLMPPAHMSVVESNGCELAVREWGPRRGPAVVLLHGLAVTTECWYAQIQALAGTRVIAYDARGHGTSGPAVGPFTADVLAQDLRAVLEASKVRRCMLAGHSMGGMTILQHLREHPSDVVRGVALVNTTFTSELGTWRGGVQRFARARTVAEGMLSYIAKNPKHFDVVRGNGDLTLWAARLAGFGAGADPTDVALVRRMLGQMPSDTLARTLIGLGDYDTLDVLEKVNVPVLIIAGEKDLISPAWLSREMAERIRGSELVILPGVGHTAMLERKAEVTERLLAFREKVLA